jgi:hypothetical protein
MKIANYMLPLLLRKERRLRKKVKAQIPADLQFRQDPDMQVF